MSTPAKENGRRSSPVSVVDHVRAVDDMLGRSSASFTAEGDVAGDGTGTGAGLASVPWQHGGQWAITHDTDHDGVPDAFDYYFGPGAFPPGH